MIDLPRKMLTKMADQDEKGSQPCQFEDEFKCYGPALIGIAWNFLKLCGYVELRNEVWFVTDTGRKALVA